jgi:DNA-binding CsgD family transcriptional regulator
LIHVWDGNTETIPAEPPAAPIDGCGRAVVRALAELAELEYRLGDWSAAYVASIEAVRAARSAGLDEDTMSGLARLASLEAALGREDACRSHAARAIELGRCHGSPATEALGGEAIGRLELGLGRIDSAIRSLEAVAAICAEHPRALAATVTWPEDLADACLRRGDRVGAERAMKELNRRAAESGSCVLVAALTRSRAMLAPDDRFEKSFREALDWAARARQPFDQARTELCFGERLRRARRRRKARDRLLAAQRTFEDLGATPWAERARLELVATGIHARRRVDATRGDLTAAEEHVAHVVAGGATNREAAARLFVTEKTIETHLSHIYRKLGLRSRTELARTVEPAAVTG